MIPTKEEQRQALEQLLRSAGEHVVSFSAMRAAGIESPGHRLYELELVGWELDHGPGGVRVRRAPAQPGSRTGRAERRP